ncbi:MAG: winged helix-turn-helix transcriptional regulator [Candidatus Aenigmatarchaeota archaeon]
MDRDFVLQYLKIEHLRGNSELMEIAENSGLEYVKELLREYPSMRVMYIPTLERNRELMMEVIRANKDKMSVTQLARKTGLSVKKVKEYLREIEKE